MAQLDIITILIWSAAGLVFSILMYIVACAIFHLDPMEVPMMLLGQQENKLVKKKTPIEQKQWKVSYPSKNYNKLLKEIIIRTDGKTGKEVMRFKDANDQLAPFEVLNDPKLFHPQDPLKLLSGEYDVPIIVIDDESTMARMSAELDDLRLHSKIARNRVSELLKDDKQRFIELADTQREGKRALMGMSSPYGTNRFGGRYPMPIPYGGYRPEGEEPMME